MYQYYLHQQAAAPVVSGGADSGFPATLAAKLLARRPERQRREEPEQERPAAPAIVARGEALFALWVDGRGKVKRRKRKVQPVAEAVYVPPPIYGHGDALVGVEAEVLVECYDMERIRSEDLALLGVV